jgi:hypothetical protein
MQPITTFAPDANPLTPGILVSASGVYPSETGGIRAIPTATPFSAALAGQCLGMFSYQNLTSSFRTIGATSTKLYELEVTSWNDVSKAGDYTGSSWNFAAWGNYILAVNGDDIIQVQETSLSDFADLAGSPIAKYITTAQNFVITANIGAVYGNRVQWCAQGDHTDWVASASTQAGYMDLSDTPGEITGLARLGDDFIVFKDRNLYHATYIGPPFIWSFRRVPAYCGAPSQTSIVELENGVYFVGMDDFYVYDGSIPKRIGQGVRHWFLGRVDRNYQSKVMGAYDGIRRLLFWFYPTAADGTSALVEGLVYDWQTQRWGRIVQTVEAVLTHWSSSITYDSLGGFFATYADLEADAPSYDSPWWGATSFGISVVDSSHRLARFSGTPGSASIITGDSGSLQGVSRVLKAFPYFNITPTTCTVTPRSKTAFGDTAVAGSTNTLKANGEVDLDRSGKFLSLQMDMTGDFEIVGFDADIKQVSRY